jgi:hypothetical protein
MAKQKQTGPDPKFTVPIGTEGAPLEIIYGHNTVVKKVLMQFNLLTSSLILTPEDARDVARKLLHYADMADGKKAM